MTHKLDPSALQQIIEMSEYKKASTKIAQKLLRNQAKNKRQLAYFA